MDGDESVASPCSADRCHVACRTTLAQGRARRPDNAAASPQAAALSPPCGPAPTIPATPTDRTPLMNIGRFITRNARYYAEHPAIIFEERVTTFRELERRANRLANALLGLGLRKGDRVAFQMSNRPAIVEIEVALYKAGLVKMPLNARLSPAEVVDVISNGEPRVFLVGDSHTESVQAIAEQIDSVPHFVAVGGRGVAGWHDYEALLARAADSVCDVEMEPGDLAVLHYTSGSTGKLKA